MSPEPYSMAPNRRRTSDDGIDRGGSVCWSVSVGGFLSCQPSDTPCHAIGRGVRLGDTSSAVARPPRMKTITGGLAVVLIASGLAACSSPMASPAPASDGPTASRTPSAPTPGATGSPPAPPTPTPPTPNPDAGLWRAAAPMNVGRVGFDAAELGDGSVLVVGDDHACIPGKAEPGSERAEVYERATDRWFEIQSLNKPRKSPATVALTDGSAMVIGGMNEQDVSFSSTKILSPSTRTWTDGPLLDIARREVHAVELGDGTVLVASVVAHEETSQLVTAEIYEPSTRAWEPVGEPLHIYMGSLMPLTDGRVLAIGPHSRWVSGSRSLIPRPRPGHRSIHRATRPSRMDPGRAGVRSSSLCRTAGYWR